MPSLVEMSFMVMVAAKWSERTKRSRSNAFGHFICNSLGVARDQLATWHLTKCLRAALFAFTRTSLEERRCIQSTCNDSR